MPVREWRFGVGQSGAEERAEIESAKAAGLSEEYVVAQSAARLVCPVVERKTGVRDAKSKEQRSKQAPRTRTRKAKRQVPTKDLPIYADRLRRHKEGRLDPIPVPLRYDLIPQGLRDELEPVARDIALVAGVRLLDDNRHIPYSDRWRCDELGMSPASVGRAIRSLIALGVITDEGTMPSPKTRLIGIPGVTADDGRVAPQLPASDGSDGAPWPDSYPARSRSKLRTSALPARPSSQ